MLNSFCANSLLETKRNEFLKTANSFDYFVFSQKKALHEEIILSHRVSQTALKPQPLEGKFSKTI